MDHPQHATAIGLAWRRHVMGASVALATLSFSSSGYGAEPAQHSAAAAQPEERTNALQVGFIPFRFGAYGGPHPDLSDFKLEHISYFVAGVSVGYEHYITRYFRFGPRAEYIQPFADTELHEIRTVLAAHGVLPLLDGAFELSLGAEIGLATHVISDSALHSLTVGAALGMRGWVAQNLALFLEAGPVWTPESKTNDDGVAVHSVMFAEVTAGAAVGW